MSVRNLAVLVVGVGLALGVAACDAEADTGAVPPAATTSATPSAASAVPVPPGTPATSVAPVASPAPSASVTAKPACPVTEAELRKAVRNKLDNGVSPESKFTKIECYKAYAVATVPERADSDEQYAVFKYTKAWALISSGSAEICPDDVPADVVKRFRAAHYGACR